MTKTIYYKEIELEIEFDYSPEEKAVLYPIENAYPGSPAMVEITSIKLPYSKVDIYDLLTDHFDELETIILNDL